MILIVFPMLSDTRYTCVKKLCCVEYPVPSQVVVFKTINKPDHVLRTVASKVVLQMNVKLGGELWSISMPMQHVMIIGIDVYHKVEKKYQSIAGECILFSFCILLLAYIILYYISNIRKTIVLFQVFF
jgi:aubergine-like protein